MFQSLFFFLLLPTSTSSLHLRTDKCCLCALPLPDLSAEEFLCSIVVIRLRSCQHACASHLTAAFATQQHPSVPLSWYNGQQCYSQAKRTEDGNRLDLPLAFKQEGSDATCRPVYPFRKSTSFDATYNFQDTTELTHSLVRSCPIQSPNPIDAGANLLRSFPPLSQMLIGEVVDDSCTGIAGGCFVRTATEVGQGGGGAIFAVTPTKSPVSKAYPDLNNVWLTTPFVVKAIVPPREFVHPPRTNYNFETQQFVQEAIKQHVAHQKLETWRHSDQGKGSAAVLDVFLLKGHGPRIPTMDIEHPHGVTLVESFPDGSNAPYIGMRRIRTTLKALIDDSLPRLPTYVQHSFAKSMIQCIRGLHQEQPGLEGGIIVHRDIKPHNILTRYNPQDEGIIVMDKEDPLMLYLIDFGLTKLQRMGELPPDDTIAQNYFISEATIEYSPPQLLRDVSCGMNCKSETQQFLKDQDNQWIPKPRDKIAPHRKHQLHDVWATCVTIGQMIWGHPWNQEVEDIHALTFALRKKAKRVMDAIDAHDGGLAEPATAFEYWPFTHHCSFKPVHGEAFKCATPLARVVRQCLDPKGNPSANDLWEWYKVHVDAGDRRVGVAKH